MMNIITPSESLQRWESLRSISRRHSSSNISNRCIPPPPVHDNEERSPIIRRARQSFKKRPRKQQSESFSSSSHVVVEDDPFDCSDVIVRPIHEQVEQEVLLMSGRWRDLDSRRVIADVSRSRSTTKMHMGKANKRLADNRVRLPINFDVACKGDGPAIPAPDDPAYGRGRDRVVSLADPTKLLDYEAELHKLFSSVPTKEEIEKEATEGSICTKSLATRVEIDEGVKSYSRLDAHSLGRLRLREKHSLPSRIWAASSASASETDNGTTKASAMVSESTETEEQRNSTSSAVGNYLDGRKFHGVTVRLECWRKMVKRGSTTDCHRLELELWGEQTLADLHKILLEFGRDAAGIVTLQDGSGSFDGRQRVFSNSGLFFIENTFYAFGEEDYSATIIDWLDGKAANSEHNASGANSQTIAKKEPIHELRKNYLGISSIADPLQQRRKPVQMSNVKLASLPFRLGQRYLHMCNGDQEVALFFTDVRVVLEDEDITRYPLIHDCWTPSSTIPDCAGCEQRCASLMMFNNDLTGNEATPLCECCFRMLNYDKDGKLHNSADGNMKVVPLAMLFGWNDSFLSSCKPNELF